MTDEEESKALGVPLHSPAFLFERTSRDEAGRTVEFVQSVYRGDRYRIVTELSRPALTHRLDSRPVRCAISPPWPTGTDQSAHRPCRTAGHSGEARVDGSRRRG